MHFSSKPCEILASTNLFAGLDKQTFQHYCVLTQIEKFTKGEIIVAQGDSCESIGVIESGQLAMQKYTMSGDFATLGLLSSRDFFGEDLLFGSENLFPYTLEAISDCAIIFVKKNILHSLMDQSSVITGNFLQILSDRVKLQNQRITLLSQKTLRQKIAFYLLELLQENKSTKNLLSSSESFSLSAANQTSQKISFPTSPIVSKPLSVTVKLPVSKEVIAKLLAMPRPSFSRELLLMEKDGLIIMEGRKITILDLNKLEHDIIEGLSYNV